MYSGHFTEFNDFTQQQLQPDVSKILKLNQDTLHVGTIAEFKENHAELFNMLTEYDRISIRLLKTKKNGL